MEEDRPQLSDEDRGRIQAAKVEARELGYTLFVEEAPNIEPNTHSALAAPYIGEQATVGRWLTHGESAADAPRLGSRSCAG